MDDGIKLRGYYDFTVSRGAELLARQKGENLVVTQGKNRAANNLIGTYAIGTSIAEFLNMGDSSTPAAESQVGLLGIVHFAYIVLTTPAPVGNILSANCTHTNAGAAVVVREMGIFFAGNNTSVFARFNPAEFTYATGDTMTFNYELEVG